jgi:hypothetical protein
VLAAVLFDVSLIAALGPAAGAVPALDVGLQHHLLRGSLRREGQQPRVSSVHEDDQRGHGLVGHARLRSDVRLAVHDETVVERHADGHHLA